MKLIWKRLSLSLMVIIPAALAALWFLWELGCLGNWGLECGYYGQFNRARHAIESMPGVVITNSWMHEDLTLEDFGFYLAADGSRDVRVDFREGSPQMSERSRRRIREYVQDLISSNSIAVSAAAGEAPAPGR